MGATHRAPHLRDTMEIADFLSDEEKSAIDVLVAGGFLAFTEARIDNVRELGTGLRRRTFRNRGRYQLVLVCQNLSDRKVSGSGRETAVQTTQRKPVPEMTRGQLLEEARGYEEITGEYAMKKAELAEAVQASRDRRDLVSRKFEV